MYYAYIIFSQKFNRYYTGSCSDIRVRLKQHNGGKVTSTKAYVPWSLVHSETFETRKDAYKREIQIKRYQKGEAFKKLVL